MFREVLGPEKKKMDHVRAIQGVVDEHKEKMPTGVVQVVMDECQNLYNAMPNLYKLTWTVVRSHAQVHEDEEDEPPFASVELSYTTQTLIVEAVEPDYLNDHGPCDRDMPNHGMILKGWLKLSMPFVMKHKGGTNLVILHSIVPYRHKRTREE